jgi:hypothetical protein
MKPSAIALTALLAAEFAALAGGCAPSGPTSFGTRKPGEPATRLLGKLEIERDNDIALHCSFYRDIQATDSHVTTARRKLRAFTISNLDPGEWNIKPGMGGTYRSAPHVQATIDVGGEKLTVDNQGRTPVMIVRILPGEKTGEFGVRLVAWIPGEDGGAVRAGDEVTLAVGQELQLMQGPFPDYWVEQ